MCLLRFRLGGDHPLIILRVRLNREARSLLEARQEARIVEVFHVLGTQRVWTFAHRLLLLHHVPSARRPGFAPRRGGWAALTSGRLPVRRATDGVGAAVGPLATPVRRPRPPTPIAGHRLPLAMHLLDAAGKLRQT